ncbi:haloacid dehalogenase type II [Robbsia sp. Bb-Pol-6]|uniref:Haloacid dehalogenase type II n=1 Tax=Robbsia betulipollinis TaxID=2981849 RepID=A0ABT3ZP45_9BURK|nr:haloacid dehalogenase type II [Robbsia betulipollinis]MCY0388177.1 haloacid dehalogenase type II [Robbsia betulipollinis]
MAGSVAAGAQAGARPLTAFTTLTFDCYGTLIDWESGIVDALRPLVARSGRPATRDRVLETFGRHESPQQQATPTALYPDILRAVYDRIAAEWATPADAAEREAFGASVPEWPAFPDSREALRYLGQHYALVILSNIDRRTFASSQARLGVDFDHVFTAEDIGSYKPDTRNFDHMIAHLGAAGIPRDAILHTAESLYHDHVPANTVGLASAWIHRRHGLEGSGATHVPAVVPRYDFHFKSLADMVAAHRLASVGGDSAPR